MTEAPSRLSDRAAKLRLAFDGAFAAPPRLDTIDQENLLGIRLAGQPYAIRLSEVIGLFADKTITRVPSSVPALLGIAGFRGAILPVYGLHLLLGHPKAEAPRWLTIASGAPIAFAFEGFDGHMRVSRDGIVTQNGNEAVHNFTREFMRIGDTLRPVVHLTSVLDAIKTRAQDSATTRER